MMGFILREKPIKRNSHRMTIWIHIPWWLSNRFRGLGESLGLSCGLGPGVALGIGRPSSLSSSWNAWWSLQRFGKCIFLRCPCCFSPASPQMFFNQKMYLNLPKHFWLLKMTKKDAKSTGGLHQVWRKSKYRVPIGPESQLSIGMLKSERSERNEQ